MRRSIFLYFLLLSFAGMILTVSSCKKTKPLYTAEVKDRSFFFFIRNPADPSKLDVLRIHVSGKTISPSYICQIPLLRGENFFIPSKGISYKAESRPKESNFICSVFDHKTNFNDPEIRGEITVFTKKAVYRYEGNFYTQNYSPVASQISLSVDR